MAADSTFPADRIINTIHFDDAGLSSDPQQLCADLVNVYQSACLSPTVREVRATCYLVGPPPQYPVAQVIENEGIAPATASNRELACCLSYYNVRSDPRKRGRLYLPVPIMGISVSGPRPAQTLIDKGFALADGLSALGGADVDWVVYSPTTKQHWDVQGVWVDDAWDVVRSRGLRPTTRAEHAVSG